MPISRTPAYRAADHGFLRLWLGSLLLAVAVTAPGAPHSGAQAEDGILTWIVKSISDEEVGVVQASAMQMPQEGSALATGQRISTGGQRMVLVNGRDLVEVRANTTITIGDNDPTTADANVDVITGTINVEVGKRTPGQTFSIGAPFLVATVKGTKFEVSTSNGVSAVSVTEGTVGVSATATGESVDVTVGNTAIVSGRSLGGPTLAPTPAGGASSVTGSEDKVENASANTGDGDGNSSGNSNSGGSGSGGSSSGGSSSGGSSSGGSGSGGSGDGSGSGGAVGDAADAVGGAVGGAAGAVGGAVGGVAGAVGGAVGGAAGAVGGAIGGPVGGAVSGVGGAVGGAVSGVGGAVGGAVGGVGGALGGAIGGLGGGK